MPRRTCPACGRPTGSPARWITTCPYSWCASRAWMATPASVRWPRAMPAMPRCSRGTSGRETGRATRRSSSRSGIRAPPRSSGSAAGPIRIRCRAAPSNSPNATAPTVPRPSCRRSDDGPCRWRGGSPPPSARFRSSSRRCRPARNWSRPRHRPIDSRRRGPACCSKRCAATGASRPPTPTRCRPGGSATGRTGSSWVARWSWTSPCV